MSERNFENNREKISSDVLNLLKDLDKYIDAVVAIEAEFGRTIDLKDRSILKQQVSDALGYFLEQRGSLEEKNRENFEKRGVSGFQGLGGFNRYSVYSKR